MRKVVGGKRIPSGVRSFHVLAAGGYAGRQFRIWALAAYPDNSAASWMDFFDRLNGDPMFVVADRGTGLVSAVSNYWPHLRLYPCVSHLAMRVREILEVGGLHDPRRAIWRLTTPSAFADPAAYYRWRRIVETYLAADLSKVGKRQQDALLKLGSWVRRNEGLIAQSLVEHHWPVSAGALEEPLRQVRARLYERRFGLGNLARLDDLLSLMALELNGDADHRVWARILRENHRTHAGKPPPRRLVDDPALAPRP